ncbi:MULTISPECIES: transaldolase [unclassified Moraxella]|uniref:transaldolase n=1 Tax=unclassified Moraxella TaxID=2685852 RepID=UPI003AF55469
MTSTLNQLKMMTTVVADTGDLQAIARLKPVDATTNPSLITKALSDPAFEPILRQSLAKHHNDIDKVIDELTVYIGTEILKLIDGRVSTEVDARLSFDTEATIAKAKEYIQAYEQAGVDKERVLIKIASTWQGIQAGRELEQQGIHCNLTLLFGLHQAKACADANITLISPFVGRILDWQKKNLGVESVAINEDKGVQSIKTIYAYYKQHGYKTQVMGASFRSVEQILALAGCDLLTIAPDLIDKMASMDVKIERQLFPDMQFEKLDKQTPDEATFNEQLNQDPMASELLQGGIDGFVKAREELVAKLQSLV